ncbi:hypothetical protein NEMBOFW57_002841 [Staphylotrichum longicolle]|uniref:DUF7136 domain-containing protein n=1 Tax=Staphylotrichum longicolle TaxID=669026 RepID=A0AAD4F434_9PEZI|nr:hypothetical protein NEMBOFW57_002841 [Staphylotrichum longicolle]
MVYSFWKLIILALAASSQQTGPPDIPNQPFEVDAVFPPPAEQTLARQDMPTFKANEVIPLVLAVQSMTAWTVGNRTMLWEWYIMSITAEGKRGPILDHGWFDNADAMKTNPALLVAVTNSSTWYQNDTTRTLAPKAPGDVYLFQWTAGLYANNDSCNFRYPEIPNRYVWKTAAIFDVLSEHEESLYTNATTAAVAIPQAPQCPELDGVYRVTYNATATECQTGVIAVETIQGNPCAAQIDNAMASSISSRVASSTSAWTASPTTTSVPTSTSSGAAGAAHPVQTAMAAACVLCGLAFT